MKKFLLFLIVFCFILSGQINATPVFFNVDGNNSSVTLTDNSASSWLGSATITGNLVPDLGGVEFTLNDNETKEIDFFTLTVLGSGIALGDYNIEAQLAFSLPEIFSAEGTGGGIFGNVFGFIKGGTLYWDDNSLPDTITLTNGNVITVDFEEGIAIGFGSTATVHAYVTNNGGAPVPEPATMLLLGSGLVGLAGFRKKFFKKVNE